MSAQPGWYDAGVPGRQRWWDGTQWTAHERAIDVAPVSYAPVASSTVPVPAAAVGHPMGWYPVPGKSDVRWWDGAGWTPYRVRDGKPRPDAFAVEPGNIGLVFGIVFLVLGLTQFTLGLASRQGFAFITPVLFFAVGVIWLIGGIHTRLVQSAPAPQGPPFFDPSTRPLPGEVEADGAGWYAVAGRVTRWTGARWTWYIGQRFGVRPGHLGPRGYLVSMITGAILAGLGALAILAGIIMAAFAGGEPVGSVIGVVLIVVGVILALMGGLVMLLIHSRRFSMILPKAPPQQLH
jgi:hypothetical protein